MMGEKAESTRRQRLADLEAIGAMLGRWGIAQVVHMLAGEIAGRGLGELEELPEEEMRIAERLYELAGIHREQIR